MENNRELKIAVADSRRAAKWENIQISVENLYKTLENPTRSSETYAEYMALPKAKQDELKDVGGFVGGELLGGLRTVAAVLGRDVAVLDLDEVPPHGTDEVIKRLEALGHSYCLHSTRKHCPEKPRLRVILPLARTVSREEYPELARALSRLIDPEGGMCDPTTFEVCRLMYFPSVCRDGEYVCKYRDNTLWEPEDIMRICLQMRNYGRFPLAAEINRNCELPRAKPSAKAGTIGAFCRAYDIHAAIDTFLADKYLPCGRDRYTYADGTTTGGAIVYGEGEFLYSHHAHDPAQGKLLNAFDLVRIHLFGERDRDAKPRTPATRLPSYLAMLDLAKKDEKVKAEAAEKALEKAGGKYPDAVKNTDAAQILASASGEALNADLCEAALESLGIEVRLNVITGRCDITGLDKAFSSENAANTLPIYLCDYVRSFGIKATPTSVGDYLSMLSDKHRRNPVEDFLTGGVWDGADRFGAIYEILGGIKSPLEQTYIRKWFIQCVALALNDPDDPIGADGVLVLHGKQGIGKTRFFTKISVRRDWFAEGVNIDTDNKDSLLGATDSWICELGELDGTIRREQESLKAHITAARDSIRAPYARCATRRARHTSYCGTVNNDKFLRDLSGSRRFWIISTDRIDLKRLEALDESFLSQLWYQAYSLYRADCNAFRLTPSERYALERGNHAFRALLPGEVEVRDSLDFTLPRDTWQWTSATALKSRIGTRATAAQIGVVLKRLMEEEGVESRTYEGRVLYLIPTATVV